MPFLIIDDLDTSGNGFDELPPGVTAEDVTKLTITAIVQQAVDAALYIEQPSGVKVCRFTGRIVDPK